MPNSRHLFADRIVNLAVTGPLVRIELGTMQLPTAEGQKPQLVPNQTLVMPLEGFVQSFGMMEGVIKRLVADGVIKMQPQGAASAETEAARPLAK
jgi:hypothetical protein